MFAQGDSPGRAEPGAVISPNNVASIHIIFDFSIASVAVIVLCVSANVRPFSLKAGESFNNEAVYTVQSTV